MCDVLLLVEVELADLLRGLADRLGHAVNDLLDDHHPLRAAEATEGGVAGLVGLAQVAHHARIGDFVAVIDVQEGAVHDGAAQVQCVASIVVQVGVQRHQLALVREANLVGCQEGVTLAHALHVLVAVIDEAHRPSGVVGGDGAADVADSTAGFLAAKATAEALCLGDDLVGRDAEAASNHLLMLRWGLGGGDAQQLVLLRGDHNGAMGLQVEMLLAAHLHLALQHLVRCLEAGVYVAAVNPALVGLEVQGVIVGFLALLVGHDGWEVLVLNNNLADSVAGNVRSAGHDNADRLPHTSDNFICKDNLVLGNGAPSLLWHILGAEEGGDAFHLKGL
mmetsp:Transcript_3838/g.10875  ORF Transcript_3838/g.10875 Transcript_3838/m.10875 type:complete len:335 (-) Transcript_3838:1309-2313(-)